MHIVRCLFRGQLARAAAPRTSISTSCLVSRPWCAAQRTFHSTPARSINPLLPFDVLEEVQNEDLENDNEKLRKQKKTLKKKLRSKEKKEQVFVTENDSIPADKTVSPQVQTLQVEKTASASVNYEPTSRSHADPANPDSQSAQRPAQNMASGSGNGNGNQPPKEEKKDEEEEEEEDEEHEPRYKAAARRLGSFLFKCLETIGITFSSVAILGVAGILYHKFYHDHVLDKIDMAFDKGDPAYQLTIHKRTNKHIEGDACIDHDLSEFWVERPQQKLLDDIVSGKIVGRYFLLVGEKGTGKTSLLLESMKKVEGLNVAIFDAHADPEIFRIRLGRALNYTFNEDYIGSLFSIKGPRDTTALLDIERAFNKLEELAIRRVAKTGNRPLVMIINNSHLIKENEEGIKLIELLQQKAESLSGSGLMTIIFNSDDYWVYEKLKKLGTRLELVNVRDFSRAETINALRFTRERHFPSSIHPHLKVTEDQCHQVYDLIGGRPQHISQVARHKDIFKACHEIIDREKTWFLNQCGLLGFSMDDDVMENGKFSTGAMLLMKEFVEMDRSRSNTLILHKHPDIKDSRKDHDLPELPLWRARQVMTRPDYIQEYDNLNIFTIDSDSRVRADSVPMMRAFHEIASQPKFDDLLDDSIERVADIESLGRTREIVLKDLNLKSTYKVKHNEKEKLYEMVLEKSRKQKLKDGDEDGDEEAGDYFLEEVHRTGNHRWAKRMHRYKGLEEKSVKSDE